MSETPAAAKAFEQYYDLGDDRSLEMLARRMHQESLDAQSENQDGTKHVPSVTGILSQLKKWSSSHEWQDRIVAKERAYAEQERKKKQKDIDKMNERHAQIGVTQQARALEQIKALMEAKSFGSMATVQLLKLSTDLERLARGAATDRQELTGKDGSPLETGQSVVVYIPDNGRDTPKQEGGDA
jgi:hypothetical protein